MRKTIIVLLSLALILALGIPALADTQVDVYDQDKQLAKSVVFALGVKEYFADNKTPGVKMDARPFIENSRTFVPVRYLSNALGVTDDYIGWESPKVTLDEPGFPVVVLAIGSKTIKSDGKATSMDVAPLLREGRTYLPARWVAEALGYQVEWDAKNQVVLCWPKGADKPDVSKVVEHITGQAPVTPPVEPDPVQPEKPVLPEGKAIDLTGKGDPFPQPLQKYMASGDKIVWLTYDEFNRNVYKLGYIETYGMRVTPDQIYITQKGGCGRVALYEGGDIFRPRSSSGPPEADDQKWEYGYTVVLDSTDKYGGWPTCDITKVSHIVLSVNETSLGIENPLYKGGK